MSLTLGRFVWPITVTAGTDNTIQWTEGGTTVLSTTLPTTTFSTPEDLISAVTNSMTTASADHTYTASISTEGVVSIVIDGSTMATSTYAEGFTLARILGGMGGKSAALTNTATTCVHGAFYFRTDGPDLEENSSAGGWSSERNAPMSVALDGTVTQRPLGSTREFCDVIVNNIPKTYAYSSTNHSHSLEDLWDYCMSGVSKAFRWYTDVSDVTSWTTIHWDMGQDVAKYEPTRLDPGLARWSVAMPFRKNV